MRSGRVASVYFVAPPTWWRRAALTETLTESFCERCGTRYEFSAPTRLNPLRKTRGLIGGLKNYLTSQDALGDALEDAMRTEEGSLATAQLDAFHEAFNFCIDCRQYTCVSCWNDDAGRCRSCVPVPGVDDLAERLAASSAAPIPGVAKGDLTDDDVARHFGVDLWPTSDLPAEAEANGHVADDSWATTAGAWTNAPEAPGFEAEQPASTVGGFVGADGFVYETKEQADKVAATMLAEAAAAQETAARAAAELEAAQAAQAAEEALAAQATPVEPDATWVDAEPATADAPEPVQAVEMEAEPVAAAAPDAEPPLHVVAWDEDVALEVEPEPVVAEAEPAPPPEPIAASSEAEPEAPTPTTRIAPISETILQFPTRPVEPDAASRVAAEDESPEVAARRAQLDLLGLDGAEQPEMPAVIPYRSRGAAITPAELALRAAAGQRFWEASAREVASAVGNVGVQNCGECGLSLSANARFCRRCGTRQAQSA
jgi:hypothetical protein